MSIKPIEVKITRAEKRNRKIILVIESDLYSNEIFAPTPFYDEGNEKNQLQNLNLDVKIKEKNNEIEAMVSFGNCLNHFTKGHSQLHKPLNKHFISQEDCALDWFMNEKEEYYTDDRIDQILNKWKKDKAFYNKLLDVSINRKRSFKIEKLNEAKLKYKKALKNLDKCLIDFTIED